MGDFLFAIKPFESDALPDFTERIVGVAYAWHIWLEGEDTIYSPDEIRETNIHVNNIEEKKKSRVEIIRELKEVQGFANKNPDVVDTVQELLRLKALLNYNKLLGFIRTRSCNYVLIHFHLAGDKPHSIDIRFSVFSFSESFERRMQPRTCAKPAALALRRLSYIS